MGGGDHAGKSWHTAISVAADAKDTAAGLFDYDNFITWGGGGAGGGASVSQDGHSGVFRAYDDVVVEKIRVTLGGVSPNLRRTFLVCARPTAHYVT